MAPLPGVIQIQVHSTMFRICDVYIGIRIRRSVRYQWITDLDPDLYRILLFS
jgi:hypothetical protein